eukprot:COSAG04_NODE_25479_length_307_cov_0.509615_1_plen_77_part_10
MSYDDETKYWKVKYETNKESEEHDADDMEAHVIRRVNGASPPDGGKAQWVKHCRGSQAAGDANLPDPYSKTRPKRFR